MSCPNEGGATSINSFKSVRPLRVDQVAAVKVFDNDRQLGNTNMCAVAKKPILADGLGRPTGGNARKFLLLNDSSCSSILYNLQNKMKDEMNERPILQCSESYNRLFGKIDT